MKKITLRSLNRRLWASEFHLKCSSFWKCNFLSSPFLSCAILHIFLNHEMAHQIHFIFNFSFVLLFIVSIFVVFQSFCLTMSQLNCSSSNPLSILVSFPYLVLSQLGLFLNCCLHSPIGVKYRQLSRKRFFLTSYPFSSYKKQAPKITKWFRFFKFYIILNVRYLNRQKVRVLITDFKLSKSSISGYKIIYFTEGFKHSWTIELSRESTFNTGNVSWYIAKWC